MSAREPAPRKIAVCAPRSPTPGRRSIDTYCAASRSRGRTKSISMEGKKALGATASSNGWRGAKDEGVAETAEASARYETQSVGASISTMAADRITP